MSIPAGPFGPLLLLLAAAGLRTLFGRLPVSPAPLLAAAGAVLALLGLPPQALLPTRHIYDLLLPLLVFEAALQADPAELRRDAFLLATLAGPGVLVGALLVAIFLWLGASWPAPAAIAFGALIAATDPVAIIASFRQPGVSPRLAMLAEAESLLNDASAAILFGLIVAGAHPAGPAPILPRLLGLVLRMVPLSAALGLGAGFLASLLRDRPRGAGLAGGIAAAYGAFFLAGWLGGSGVLAGVVCGLVVGARAGPARRAARLRRLAPAAAVCNSAVFLLVGGLLATSGPAILHRAGWIALPPVLLARALVVFGLCGLLARSSRPSLADQALLVGGGMRGALALALALLVPPDLPGAAHLRAATLDCVAFAILVQGPALSLWFATRARAA